MTSVVEGTQVKIAIADNSLGIPEEVKPRIFDHLFTIQNLSQNAHQEKNAFSHQFIVENTGKRSQIYSASPDAEFPDVLP